MRPTAACSRKVQISREAVQKELFVDAY